MINQRMCVVCRQRKNKNELVRIVSKDGFATIDQHKEVYGRAIYICKQGQCVEALKKKNLIKRMLKSYADDELFEKITKVIEGYQH